MLPWPVIALHRATLAICDLEEAGVGFFAALACEFVDCPTDCGSRIRSHWEDVPLRADVMALTVSTFFRSGFATSLEVFSVLQGQGPFIPLACDLGNAQTRHQLSKSPNVCRVVSGSL